MSLKKFGENDVIVNTMKAYPRCKFFVFDGKIYYNDAPAPSGAFSDRVYNVPPGHISLYEYNIDRSSSIGNVSTIVNDEAETGGQGPRAAGDDGLAGPGPSLFIYPYITKGGAGTYFSSVGNESYTTDYSQGDIITSSYPMSASITREFMSSSGGWRWSADGYCKDCRWVPVGCSPEGTPCTSAEVYSTGGAGEIITYQTSSFDGSEDVTRYYDGPKFRHFYALKNRLEFYGVRSEHYKVSSSYGDKSKQIVNLISIPSILYGSAIKPGSLSLKWYLTGSLIGELRDTKQNGELIEVTGSNTGLVAGVVLYEEGFILLTGSWDLNHETIGLISKSPPRIPKTPQWIYFGAGANDGVNQTTAGSSSFNKASFDLSFKGTTETQVLTMFAHAKRGETNFSNNPTFLAYSQSQLDTTSSQVYQENASRTIYNTVSSSYSDYGAPFKRQVYISRVAIYDEKKNLIGIATLANPILKKEDRDLSFKLKLDI
jgi:hypothetical protein